MNILFLAIGFIAAWISAWFIAKYKFTGNAVSKTEYETIKNELNNSLTNYQIEFEKSRSLSNSIKVAELSIEQKSLTINELTGKLSSQENETSNLNARLLEAKNEQAQAQAVMEFRNEEIKSLNKELSAKNAGLESIQATARNQNTAIEELKKEVKLKDETINDLVKKASGLDAARRFLEEKLENQNKEIEEVRTKFQTEFQNIANQIMEEKSQKFTEMNKNNIESILKPLGENLESFKKRVEETYDKESKQRFSLEEKIKELVVLNTQISQEANNLTNALKGQAKTQGNWGEMILESILEKSGLTKGREYSVQESIRDHNGNLLKPDVIISYPDNRKVVIDSKVSLVAYERFASAETREMQDLYLDEHIKSIKNHIDGLSSKNYQDYVASLDFTMMFVPIEPAYLFAMQKDPELWNYAYLKRILLISPTNLIAALKLIADLWKIDYQNRNSLEIAEQGAKLYDKFVTFVETLQDVGKHIDKTHDSYSEAMKLLKEGRGNLIGQAQRLKELKVKAKRSIPPALLSEHDLEEDIENKQLTV